MKIYDKEVMLNAGLLLYPPIVRKEITADGILFKNNNIPSDVNISLADGSLVFRRSTLFTSIKRLQTESSSPLTDTDNTNWMVSIQELEDSIYVSLKNEKYEFHLDQFVILALEK